jgi:hypothetical protein
MPYSTTPASSCAAKQARHKHVVSLRTTAAGKLGKATHQQVFSLTPQVKGAAQREQGICMGKINLISTDSFYAP